MSGKFLIIDGSSLLYRAFYALPPLVNSKGVNTGAVYGFTNMLIKLLAEVEPKYIVVAFDKSRKTFRTELYNDYKTQRKETPQELVEQFPLIKQLLTAWGITTLEIDGYEADDIIGTLAAQASNENIDNIIVTGDRDALQLIDEKTTVLITKKGISTMQLFDVNVLKEEYDLTPPQIVDLKGLMGDSSDNIPGVPGVGEKTALKLLKEYQTVENLLANVDKVKGKLGEKLVANKQQAEMSKVLATICKQVPLSIDDLTKLTINMNKEQLEKLLAEFEFRNVANKIFSNPSKTVNKKQSDVSIAVEEITELEEAKTELLAENTVFYIKHLVEGDFPRIKLVGLEVFNGKKAFSLKNTTSAWQIVDGWLKDDSFKKVGCNIKSLYQVCQNADINLAGIKDDCAVMAYLIDPAISKYDIKSLSQHFAVDNEELTDVENLAKLYVTLKEKMQHMEIVKLYEEIEFPLIKVLAEMELNGIAVNKNQLQDMSKKIGLKVQQITKKIHEMAGEEFNISSPKQLGVILFERLALPVMKKTKRGYSTDAEVLDNLSGLHPIVDAILEYRLLSKLQSTYLEGMQPLIDEETNRIYSHFQQLVTTTGRLSSTEPNLQNIPVRSELGKHIREFFVPGKGFDYMMSFDYSQVELRILAHISGDPLFTEAFAEGQDIHTRTASEVFGEPLESVTSEQRSRAKAVNFGIAYGISDYGLARDLGISRTEASSYIKNYFERYTGIKKYMEETIEQAKQKGYVTTMFNRRRYLPEINDRNFNRRSFAERTAINTPIQGTAADIIKLAMVEVAQLLKEHKLKSRMLLQVHDELVFEVVKDEVEVLTKLVKERMQQAVKLNVPLVVDAEIGENWAQTKG